MSIIINSVGSNQMLYTRNIWHYPFKGPDELSYMNTYQYKPTNKIITCMMRYWKCSKVLTLIFLLTDNDHKWQRDCSVCSYWWRKPGCPGENHRPVVSNWQTLSHNVVSSTSRLSGVQTDIFNDDRHWLHR